MSIKWLPEVPRGLGFLKKYPRFVFYTNKSDVKHGLEYMGKNRMLFLFVCVCDFSKVSNITLSFASVSDCPQALMGQHSGAYPHIHHPKQRVRKLYNLDRNVVVCSEKHIGKRNKLLTSHDT